LGTDADSVPVWLRQLGLERYEQVFADNDIDIEALRLLGEDDLEKLGVSLGHRKRMLQAIAAFDGATASAPAAAPRPSEAEPPRGAAGERRHVTALFCDMVGFTEFAGRVDPEVLQRIVNRYENACDTCVSRYGGSVFKRLGDGIIAFFGYPLAHEDEAERAIRAALDILAALRDMQFPEIGHIAVRVGIANGLVVMLSGDKDAVGDTMAIASRLQGVAEPDTIVVSEGVRRLAGSRFEYRDKGEPELKGVTRPIHVWQVAGLRRVVSRFEAMHHLAPLTPFVGRAAEAGLVREQWEKASAGQGQVIGIGGEAGIGKSRLARIVCDEMRDDPSVWVTELQCSPFHTSSALYPVANELRRLIVADRPDGDDAARWAALQSYLRGTSLPVAEALPLFADLFSIAPPADHPVSPMTPERARLMLRQFIVAALIDQARSGPGIVIVEDLHWADPSTLEIVDLLMERVRDARILVVLTYRSEFQRALASHPHVKTLALARLRSADASELVRQAFAGQELGSEVMNQVVAKTDGVPLYIEEFTKAVAEAREAAAVSTAVAQVVIPESLQDSLVGRLDLLGAVKDIAQLAAMLGREFRRDILAAIWTGSAAALAAGLARLTQAEFIYPVEDRAQQRYIFKHALIQDAAYESLLKSHRATHHRRIAETLEAQFADIAAEQPELVAHHYWLGQHPERAAHLWLQSGQRSLRRNAHVEAAAHLRSALEAIAALSDTPARALTELDVQITLGTALVAAKGYASADVEAAWTRAQHLCSVVGNVPQQVPALFGLWMFETVRANHRAGMALSQTIVQLAEAARSDDILIEGHLAMGISRFFLGELPEARRSFDLIMATYDAEKHGGHRFQFGQDPAAIALIWLCWIDWLQGDFAAADGTIARATDFARSLKHPFTLSYVLAYAGYHQQYRRDLAALDGITAELIPLCMEEQIPVFLANGLMLAGWSQFTKGETDGPAALRQGLEIFRSTGSRCFLPYWLSLLAEILSARGEHAAAVALVEEADADMAATGEHWAEPEILRLHGEVLARSGAAGAAVDDRYRRAIDSARSRGMRSWELRAATSLARSLEGQRRGGEAQVVLSAALDNLKELAAGRDYSDALDQRQALAV
jgi:class 3 adenylate cyclase